MKVQIIRTMEEPVKRKDHKKITLKRRVDYTWDYKNEKTKTATHGLHTYPAMFIPQVAKRLIETYSKKGDTICDIFCGSGTTLVESRLLGRNSYGIDLNPFASFLATVKTTPINPAKLNKEYFNLLSRIDTIKNKEVKKPDFFNIDFWFKNDAITCLAKIKKAIKEIKSSPVKNFFLTSFSETVRLVSNTRNGEFKLFRIAKDKLDIYNPDVIGTFKKKTETNILNMENFFKSIDNKTKTTVIYGNSATDNKIPKESIDSIITSPPYGDSRTTVAYGQFSRLSTQWIDILEDPNTASKIDKELLGGRPSADLKNNLHSEHLAEVLKKISSQSQKRAKDVLSFYLGLEQCLRQAHYMLKPNKYFCIVIGNRLVKQVRIPTDFIIAELCINIGFVCEDIFVRNIPGKRMPLKNSPTNVTGQLEETMNKESIVILKKI